MVSNASIRKVAVVTGSSKGIGKAIALAFAKSGDYSGVVINSRDLEEAKRVSKEINDSFTDNCDSIAIAGDVSKEEDCIRLIADTQEI
jgi:NAD(P)-dependent dehydrogenase (short-subunit alcohol dehydrogenase family)